MNNAIIFLVLICIVMILVVFQGPNLSFDDYNYIHYAHQMLNGTFNPLQSPYSFGYLLPYTVYLSYSLLGVSTFSASLPAMLEYVTLILLIYAISKKLSDNKIALATSVIAATSAFIVAYSSRVLPDMLVGDIVALSVWLIVANEDVPSVSAILSGFVSGVLIFIKMSSLVIGIPIAIALFLGKHKEQAGLYLMGIVLVVLVYIMTMGYNLSIFQQYQANQIRLDATSLEINFFTMFVYIFPILFFYQSGAYWQIFPLGLLFDFALIGGYIAFLKKESQYAKWLVVLLIGFFYLQFGSESLTSYVPIVVVSRYFIILSPIMAILCTRFLQGVYDYMQYKYKLTTANIVLGCFVLIAIIIQLPMLYYFHLGAPHFVGAPIDS